MTNPNNSGPSYSGGEVKKGMLSRSEGRKNTGRAVDYFTPEEIAAMERTAGVHLIVVKREIDQQLAQHVSPVAEDR